MKLSIFLPGIRINKWIHLYESITKSFSGEFELVMVGPYDPPENFISLPNTKFIKDFGSPTRCQQIALSESSGEYVLLGADDGLFHAGSLDKCFNVLKTGYKDIIIARYTEGAIFQPCITGEYWYLKFHDAYKDLNYLDLNWYVANNILVRKEYIIDIGGYDCRFEGTAFAVMDLGIRVQRDGANCSLSPDIVLHCEHMPGDSGDHGPIHMCGVSDYNKFLDIYSNENCLNRTSISFDNWKDSSSIWDRRSF